MFANAANSTFNDLPDSTSLALSRAAAAFRVPETLGGLKRDATRLLPDSFSQLWARTAVSSNIPHRHTCKEERLPYEVQILLSDPADDLLFFFPFVIPTC